MAKNLKDYGLFGSLKRGSKEVEEELEDLVAKMQTPENLEKMARAVSSKRDKSSESLQPAKLDFSKFEGKLNQAKKAYFGNNDLDKSED